MALTYVSSRPPGSPFTVSVVFDMCGHSQHRQFSAGVIEKLSGT